MSSRSRTASTVILLAAFSAAIIALGEAEDAPRLVGHEGALVSFVAGSVDVVRADGHRGAPCPLLGKSEVFPGDTIVTGPEGRVELQLSDPPRTIRLERESVVALMGQERGRRIVLIGMRVESGHVWVEASAETGARTGPFMVVTNHATARLHRATMAVLRDDGESRFSVFDGAALVDGLAGLRLKAGQGVAVDGAGRTREYKVATDGNKGWLTAQVDSAEPTDETPGPALQNLTLSHAIRDLNPEIYLGVDLELEGVGRRAVSRSGESMAATAGQASRFQTHEARVRKIRVRSSAWDGLGPDRKVELLNQTYAVLKLKYPSLLNTVILEFDDARPALELRYSAATRS